MWSTDLAVEACEQVKSYEGIVKKERSENGVITDPFFLSPEHLISDAKALMARYRISGVPITEGKKLVGILTNRDLRFETDDSRPIGQVMTRENLVTAPVGTTLEQAKDILAAHRIELDTTVASTQFTTRKYPIPALLIARQRRITTPVTTSS